MVPILKAVELKENNSIINKAIVTSTDVLYNLKQVLCNVVDSWKKIISNLT
jgi:hypothetical protein